MAHSARLGEDPEAGGTAAGASPARSAAENVTGACASSEDASAFRTTVSPQSMLGATKSSLVSSRGFSSAGSRGAASEAMSETLASAASNAGSEPRPVLNCASASSDPADAFASSPPAGASPGSSPAARSTGGLSRLERRFEAPRARRRAPRRSRAPARARTRPGPPSRRRRARRRLATIVIHGAARGARGGRGGARHHRRGRRGRRQHRDPRACAYTARLPMARADLSRAGRLEKPFAG